MTRRRLTLADFEPHRILPWAERAVVSHNGLFHSVLRATTPFGRQVLRGRRYEIYDGNNVFNVNTLREVNEIINA